MVQLQAAEAEALEAVAVFLPVMEESVISLAEEAAAEMAMAVTAVHMAVAAAVAQNTPAETAAHTAVTVEQEDPTAQLALTQ